MGITRVEGNPFKDSGPKKVEGNPFVSKDRKKSVGDEITGFMANVNRGLGIGDEMAAGAQMVSNALTGRRPIKGVTDLPAAYRDAMAGQRAVEDDFAERRPLTAAGARGTGMAVTAAVPSGATVASGNALMAGLRGATGAAASGYGYGLADRGTLEERVKNANVSAAVAAPLGFGAGAAASALTGRARSAPERAVRQLAQRSHVTPDDMRANAADIRSNGFAGPTLVDVTDESGRAVIRAAASRQTPARQTAREFAESRALDLPDRIGQQARRTLSDDPRAPAEIANELGEARRLAGNADFGAVRGERVALTPDAVAALRTDDGRDAIRAAAAASLRSMNPEERAIGAELNRLAGEVLDRPGEVQITVGMAQSISESLFDAADAAARAGRNRMAGSLGDLARAVRNNAADNVPGYRSALDNYAAQSAVMEAAERGEDFLRRNTDEFVAETPAPGQPGNLLARATARRAIERAAGENPSAAPGVARRLSTAPEQRARNEALLGDEAGAFEAGMATEARMVQNATDISPRTGSQTQLRAQDAANLADGIRDVTAIASGNPAGILSVVLNRLRTAGMSDGDARALVELSVDPTRLNEAIAYLEAMGANRQQAANIVRQLHLTQASGVAAGGPDARRPAIEAYVVGRPDLGYGAAYGPN